MILLTYGTRPEYIKIKPLIGEMNKRGIPHKTLFTGQHKDLATNNATFNYEMKDDGSNRLDSIIKSCMSLPNEWFEGITHVLVQGDTTSVVGLALTALHRKLKVIHLEAGLRTYDKENPFPEENNRRIVSTIADIHLCPTEQNKQNLINEKVAGDIYVVGNTGLDNLYQASLTPMGPGVNKNLRRLNLILNGDTDVKLATERKVLITLHRRENHEKMDEWFRILNSFAKYYLPSGYSFILPMHPNPNVQKHRHLLPDVKVIEPLNHDELLELLMVSQLVVTDSGGLQEECSFLRKRCLVCRKVTERPESLGSTSTLIETPEDLYTYFDVFLALGNVPNEPCPFGDGHASEKICDIFEGLV